MSSPDRAYPPIADYALIGDTRTAALVSRRGAIEWLCLPDFDGPSVFAAILDRLNGGWLRLGPTEEAEISRRYLDDAPVLETRFETEAGTATVTDFMPLLDDAADRLEPERQIVRVVAVETGEVDIELLVTPRPGYARKLPDVRGSALGWTFSAGSDSYLLRTDLEIARQEAGRLAGRTRLGAGERRYVSLSYTGHDIGIVPVLPGETEEKLQKTHDWWRDWTQAIRYDGSYAHDIRRSAMALRLLISSQSGAVIAAPTSSLPEAIGGRRNWDYRYCWLRDASFILQSLTGLGLTGEADAFFSWLIHATQLTRPKLATLYDLYGRTGFGERELRQFEGYRGSGPVRWGNAAAHQLQLDVYGSVVTAVDHHVRAGGSLQPDEKRVLRRFGRKVCEVWRQPDNGIWEFRGPRRHTTYGKVMCWAALDRLLSMASEGILDVPEEEFRREAETLRETILRDGWSETRQAFTGAFGHDFLDASLLAMPRLGIIDPNDERMRSTYAQIVEHLGHGYLIDRYEHYGDDFPSREGAFGVCGFWAAEYLALRGDLDAARERFEGLLGYGNDLGLHAEEVDQQTGAALGNFPQALTHVGLINAALAIAAAERAEVRPA